MNQAQRRLYLIDYLLKENDRYNNIEIPTSSLQQKNLLRSLMNVRLPAPISSEYIKIEQEYLQAEIEQKGIVKLSDLAPIDDDLYLWQGDITTLECDAIVNAANSGLLGCFQPLHSCIDNCIHSFAGLQLRNACFDLMQKQGHEEPTGQAKITPAFSLPCKFVLHTVGPIVGGMLSEEDCKLLESCYRSCLALAEENACQSIAFCCISTGVFGFPQKEAAEIATKTVKEYKAEHGSGIKVIFNVFKNVDYLLYRDLLS